MPANSGFVFFAILCGLGAGCLLGTQPSVNGFLGQNVAHPIQATVISFSSGTAIVILLALVMGIFPPRFVNPPSSFPWWAWFGGAIGVVMVTTSLFFVPRVGSLVWFAAIMTGQTGIAIVIDHFGLLGNPKSTATPLRLVGALLLIAGVIVIVQAKRMEQGSTNDTAQPSTTSKNA